MLSLLPWFCREPVRLGQVGPLWLFPYAIPNQARTTHMYVIGTTGQGKSKFLESLLVADIRAARGCGLVDPHSDLAQDTLAHLLSVGYFRDPAAYERIIYFDPTRTDYVLPFNVLKTPLPPYTLAQQVIEAFRRTWPQALEEAPRFANIALAALLVLIETSQSLVEMAQLLTDKDYRENLLQQVRDPQLVDFFHTRFDRWGREGPLMIESTLNKVSAFSFNPHLRHLLGANENRLDFRRIMDEGQVLIVDLGNCDGETRRLVGSLVVTGMEMAALSRKDHHRARRPFYWFLDEFQDFCAGDGAAKTLAQILSECRKFGLHLHLAHQTLGQVQQRVNSALGNVGIKVVFAIDREDAEVMARKLFAVDTEQVKHDAQTETQHPLFSPLPEQWEQAVATIQELPARTALVKRRGRGVVQMRTEPIAPYQVSPHDVDILVERLARAHGVALTSVTQTQPAPTRPAAPIRLVDWEAVPLTLPYNSAGNVIFDRGRRTGLFD
ncbi:MAG: type IV secretion system DNA-binding domain-containing protein [Acidobacteria bacterium]|nr:type IV secretion system DNA-binding domain-containing protein [Acidobacteriota bacterium]